MLIHLKCKGISPESISAIHDEIDRIKSVWMNHLYTHVALRRFRERVARRCVKELESIRERELLEHSMFAAAFGGLNEKRLAIHKILKDPNEGSFEVDLSLSMDGDLQLRESKLTDQGDYTIEVQIPTIMVNARVSLFFGSDETELRFVKSWEQPFNPGTKFYGKLYELLGLGASRLVDASGPVFRSRSC